MNIKTNKGFSLIEILVVMGLIGVLTAIAIPAYNTYRGNANKTVLKSDVGNAYKAYHAYNAVEGNFCADLSGAGLNALKTSNTYKAKSFVGFDSLETGQCGTLQASNIKEVDASPPSTARALCKLGSGTFKFGVINEFDNKEVGYSVANNNSAPKTGGAYCKVSSSDPSEATGANCNTQGGCTTAGNNCGGTGLVGVWESTAALCR